MGTKAGVGISRHRDPHQAGEEAVQQAMKDAGLTKCDIALMYATIGYDQRTIVQSVRNAVGGAQVVGCSAEGVIAGGDVDESNFSVAVMVIESDELRFTPQLATGLKSRPEEVGTQLGNKLKANLSDDAIAVIVLADGITVNFDRFNTGFENALGRRLPLLGGSAGDNFEMKATYQYLDSEVVSDGVITMLISGDAKVAWDVNHGCIPIDVERKITKARGNLILEIDNKPVLDVLKDYLLPEEIDNWEQTVVNLCLGFRAPKAFHDDYDQYLIRFMPQRDVKEGSVVIPTEVTEGMSVWMTRRDQDKILGGCKRIGSNLRAQLGGREPKLVFQFDCAGRGKFVFRDDEKRAALATIRDQVSTTAPWVGFFTFGEIGPVNGENCFHNYTAVVAVLY
ncbi:MAG: FIST C-terminal domain-containing protein [Deltaproteobacteria bacterium]|nr:FIST C-terminal domain-containing protein [Deltaproteobacteria bacterium]